MHCSHHKTAVHVCNSSWNLESLRRVAWTHLRRAQRKTSAKANGKHETREMIYDGQFRAGVAQRRVLSIRIVRGKAKKKISFALERNRVMLRNGHVSVRTNVDDCRGENAPLISIHRWITSGATDNIDTFSI